MVNKAARVGLKIQLLELAIDASGKKLHPECRHHSLHMRKGEGGGSDSSCLTSPTLGRYIEELKTLQDEALRTGSGCTRSVGFRRFRVLSSAEGSSFQRSSCAQDHRV